MWKCFAEIVSALKVCHRRKDGSKTCPVLHRDIKPGNILLDNRGRVKMGDFGLAKQLASQSKFAYTNVGTPFYMSPEMINETKYNEKSDIWALGCLVYEMCALKPPFDATNHLSLAVKINTGKFDRIPAKYSDELHRAVRWCLQLDSAARPTVEELERLPAMRLPAGEAALTVREYTLTQAFATRMRDVKAREADLDKREAALAAREAALAAAHAGAALPAPTAPRTSLSAVVLNAAARGKPSRALPAATHIP